jgi:hypothetical protein
MAGLIGKLYSFNYYYSEELQNSFYTAFFKDEKIDKSKYALQTSKVWYLLAKEESETIIINRYYNPFLQDYYYGPKNTSLSGYTFEKEIGYSYSKPGENRMPIYEWWNPIKNDHMYTIFNFNTERGYIKKGINWYSPIPTKEYLNSETNESSPDPIFNTLVSADPPHLRVFGKTVS